jgi:DnaK suppressor protein
MARKPVKKAAAPAKPQKPAKKTPTATTAKPTKPGKPVKKAPVHKAEPVAARKPKAKPVLQNKAPVKNVPKGMIVDKGTGKLRKKDMAASVAAKKAAKTHKQVRTPAWNKKIGLAVKRAIKTGMTKGGRKIKRLGRPPGSKTDPSKLKKKPAAAAPAKPQKASKPAAKAPAKAAPKKPAKAPTPPAKPQRAAKPAPKAAKPSKPAAKAPAKAAAKPKSRARSMK